jgi:hypothetical protein
MKNDTNTLYWLIAIGLWIMALIVGSCALTGCGGDPFVLDAPAADAAGDAGQEANDDAGPDAAPDHAVGIPRPDAGTDARDASPETSPPDAAPEASTEVEAGCTPWPTSTALCPRIHLAGYPAQIAYTIPDQYCVVLYDGPFPNADPPGTPVIMTMPAACHCSPPGYTTACLTDQAPAICPPGSTFHNSGGIFADDAGTESEIICYGQGDGG